MVERMELLRRLRSVRRTIENVRGLTLFVGVEARLHLAEFVDREVEAEWQAIISEISVFDESVVPALKDAKRRKKHSTISDSKHIMHIN